MNIIITFVFVIWRERCLAQLGKLCILVLSNWIANYVCQQHFLAYLFQCLGMLQKVEPENNVVRYLYLKSCSFELRTNRQSLLRSNVVEWCCLRKHWRWAHIYVEQRGLHLSGVRPEMYDYVPQTTAELKGANFCIRMNVEKSSFSRLKIRIWYLWNSYVIIWQTVRARTNIAIANIESRI